MRVDEHAGDRTWIQVGNSAQWNSFLNRGMGSNVGSWPAFGEDVFGNTYASSNRQPGVSYSGGHLDDVFDVPLPKQPVPVNMVMSKRRFDLDHFNTF